MCNELSYFVKLLITSFFCFYFLFARFILPIDLQTDLFFCYTFCVVYLLSYSFYTFPQFISFVTHFVQFCSFFLIPLFFGRVFSFPSFFYVSLSSDSFVLSRYFSYICRFSFFPILSFLLFYFPCICFPIFYPPQKKKKRERKGKENTLQMNRGLAESFVLSKINGV